MAKKKPPAEVIKLAQQHTKKKMANEVTIGKRLKTRKPQPAPKGEPKNVFGLIARFMKK